MILRDWLVGAWEPGAWEPGAWVELESDVIPPDAIKWGLGPMVQPAPKPKKTQQQLQNEQLLMILLH